MALVTKRYNSMFHKVSKNAGAGHDGGWFELYSAAGIPAAGPVTGVAGAGTVIKQSVQKSGLMLGNRILKGSKKLTSLQGFSPASTLVPGLAILVDFLAYWPAVVATGTPTVLTAAPLPRYKDGIGVMAIAAVQAALGAAAPALTLTCTYNDDAQAAGGALTSPENSAAIATLLESGGQPFMPLPAGKEGIKSIDSYTLASGTTGTVLLMLVKPLAMMEVVADKVTNVGLLTQNFGPAEIDDDAHLGFIVMAGGALAASSLLSGMAGLEWEE